MNKETVSRLFRSFETFNPDGLNSEGTGLGLKNCLLLAQLLGPAEQQFEVSSELGSGSTFSFCIFKNYPSQPEKKCCERSKKSL